MASLSNGNFPIQSKSPLIPTKQSIRPNLAPGSSLRMSDQNEYIKPFKEASKMSNSQSTTILQKKPSQDPFCTMQMQGVLEGKTVNFNDIMTPCAKHPKKKAKYYIKEKDYTQKIELFCSKCALDFAMKGIRVEKFLNKEEKYRKNIIDQFLGKISEVKAFCGQMKVSFLKQKSENTAIQSFRLESLRDFFIGLETLINEEKNAILSEIQANSSKNMMRIDGDFESIGTINAEIERFQDDINQNYAKIINKMELNPFLEIMLKYEEKLRFLTEALQVPIHEEVSQEIMDFRKPSKDFFENIRNLIRLFIGLNSRTRRTFEEENEKPNFELHNNAKDVNLSKPILESHNNKGEALMNKPNMDFRDNNNNEASLKKEGHNNNNEGVINKPNMDRRNNNINEITVYKPNFERHNNENPLIRLNNEVKPIDNSNKTIDMGSLNTNNNQKEVLRDKTIEVMNTGNRKTSFSNKENQEKNINELASHTQRNPVTNEHIYSNILNNMTGIKKGNNNMKGFFSGLGKNYKTFNTENKGEKTGKNQHFETRIATIHVPMNNNINNK